MAGQRQVLLHLRELRRQDHRNRVLLAVDRALLQSGEQLGEGHRRGQDAEGLVALHVHLVFHRAHLQPARIFGVDDRVLVVRHVAKAVLPPRERFDAFRIEFGEQILPDRTIEHGTSMRVIVEQKRYVENGDFGHEVRHRTGRCHRQIERAKLNTFDRLTLGAQRSGIEILDLVAAVGSLLDLARERVDGDAVMRILSDGDVHLERGLRVRSFRCHDGHHQRERPSVKCTHESSGCVEVARL